MKGQKRNKGSLVIGLTGSFGSGKTTAAKILKSYGAEIIDADKLAHGCILPKSPAYAKIIDACGNGILKRNRIIDRRKLADIVFNNINLLIKLNDIIHPQVIRIIKNKIKSLKAKVIVLDAPLLIEAGLNKLADKLIVVKIKKPAQIKRIKNRTLLSKADILKRINSQIPLSQKVSLADFVIDNNGTITETERQIRKIWIRLQPQMAAD